ncbi:MAG: FHA domain-containing protein [Prevotella sp.]|jgi:DNA-directed RNA polymerase subunit RPC12/RpoP|nr:FHA domain-containing protein [Prevotella sp.]
MDIIIGRNAQNGTLNFTMGQKTTSYGAPNSVPRSVSRRHCRIEVLPNGTYTIENLKMENDTFVNGSPIFKKTVTTSDTIELGGERYKLSWEVIQKIITSAIPAPPKTADIRPLRYVWERYERDTNAIASSMAKKNAIRGGTGAISMIGMAVAFIPGLENVRIIMIVIAVFIIILMAIISLVDAQNAPKKRKALQQRLRNEYVCPNCKKFFMNMDYDLLHRQYDNCPYCKAKFIK